jgi:hypothetical protein
MEILLALCLGITLSAACGFRIFIPPLVMSVATIYGDFTPAPQFVWLGTFPALLTLAIAATVEIAAYYIPAVDNALDLVAIPTAIAIGTALSAATLGDIDPVLQWTIAAIAGGGSAGAVESFTSVTRLASTTMTAGLGNSVFSSVELISAIALSLLGLFVPLLAGIVVILVLWIGIRQTRRFWHHRRRQQAIHAEQSPSTPNKNP